MEISLKHRTLSGVTFLILSALMTFMAVYTWIIHNHFRLSLIFMLPSFLLFVIVAVKSMITKDNGRLFIAALFQFFAWMFLDLIVQISLGHTFSPKKSLDVKLNNLEYWEYAVIGIGLLLILGAVFYSKSLAKKLGSKNKNKFHGVIAATFGTILGKTAIVFLQEYKRSAQINLYFFVIFIIMLIAFFILSSMSFAYLRYSKVEENNTVEKKKVVILD